jgi:hypothetical protein
MPHAISERVLIGRINRKLALDGERLHKFDPRWRNAWEYGPYYIVDVSRNFMTAYGIGDLEGLGRELGVLAGGEALAAA